MSKMKHVEMVLSFRMPVIRRNNDYKNISINSNSRIPMMKSSRGLNYPSYHRIKNNKRQFSLTYNDNNFFYNSNSRVLSPSSTNRIKRTFSCNSSIGNNDNVKESSLNKDIDSPKKTIDIELSTSKYGKMKNASPYTSHFILGAGNVNNTNDGIVNTDTTNNMISMNDNDENVTVIEAIASILKERTGEEREIIRNMKDVPAGESLTSYELLKLGSVWFLPSEYLDTTRKPLRLSLNDSGRILKYGDYLRVHHTPRRFPICYHYDWGNFVVPSSSSSSESKPGVIVSRNDSLGYLIIDKPVGVSTNPTVDNYLECVATAVQQQFQKQQQLQHTDNNNQEEAQVSIPQRLDQLTSGLLLLATKKSFSSYFAKLLSNKTHHSLSNDSTKNNHNSNEKGIKKKKRSKRRKSNSNCGHNETDLYKKYKCLVCITSTTNENDHNSDNDDSISIINNELNRLNTWVNNKAIIKHYIESSFASKKTFSNKYYDIDNDSTSSSSWKECLLRIVHVSNEVYPLYASTDNTKIHNVNNDDDDFVNDNHAIAATLWNSHGNIPKNCRAVVELEIELLTGRTHQIRGQLSYEGFPIVGDVLYGGAISDHDDEYSTFSTYRNLAHPLALQCCQLSFIGPPVPIKDTIDISSLSHERHWNHFYLKDAWWTPFLNTYSHCKI